MKTLDTVFIHYGIRGEDMKIIEQLCQAQDVDFEWLQESVLKNYHSLKTNNEEIDTKKVEKMIEKAIIQKIK